MEKMAFEEQRRDGIAFVVPLVVEPRFVEHGYVRMSVGEIQIEVMHDCLLVGHQLWGIRIFRPGPDTRGGKRLLYSSASSTAGSSSVVCAFNLLFR